MVATSEREKYSEIWSLDSYRQFSPGAAAVPRFLAVSGAEPPATVADFGCGIGAGMDALADAGFSVVGYDFAGAADWSPRHRRPIMDACLWTGPFAASQYGYCVDVMEHLPTEFCLLAVERMLAASERSLYLEIALTPDTFGALIGRTLHETVRPYAWWRDRLREVADVAEARDLGHHGAYLLRGRAC